MNKLLKSGLYLSTALVGLAALSALTPAMAADDTGIEAMRDIVVTATRREERLQDVPISITVFNQQQLSNANITNSADLAAYTPSLSADSRFGSENTTFSIRGFTQEIRTAPSVGVFFADVVSPRGGGNGLPSGDGAGPGNLFDLQNVQVLKGPQGTLFGRNTTGGNVMLVPEKPKSEFGGYLEGSYGNYDMWRLQGVLNLPVNETMRLRLGVDRQTRDGYIKNLGPGPERLADVDYTALRASFVWDVTPDIENYTIASYINSDNHPSVPKLTWANEGAIDAYDNALAAVLAADPMDPNLPTLQQALGMAAIQALIPLAAQAQLAGMGDDFYTVDSYDRNLRSRTEQWQVINTTTWSASDTLTVKNIASYSEYRQRLQAELNGSHFFVPQVFGVTYIPNPMDPMGAPIFDSTGLEMQTNSSNPAPGRFSAAQRNITEELQFQGRAMNDRLIWQAGAYLELSDPMQTIGSISGGNAACPTPLTLDNVDQCINPYALDGSMGIYGGGAALASGWLKYRDYALYAQASYDLTDKLKLTGGFRYTWDKTIGMSENINYVYTVYTPTGYIADTSADANWMHCATPGTSLADNCRRVVTQNSNAPTWVIELQYSPTPSTMTYAKYSRGYRQGGVVTINPPGLESFEPEKIDAYEIGLKTRWGGSIPGMLDIAAFYNDLSNQQLQMGIIPCIDPSLPCYGNPDAPPFYVGAAPTTAIVNAGSSRVYGIEVNASVSPFKALRLDGSYSYLNSLLKEFDTTAAVIAATNAGVGIIPTAAEGYPLAQTPKHKATISATYTLPIPKDYGDLSVTGTYVYTGRYLTTTPAASPEPYVPSTELVNFNLNWTGIGGSRLDASAFVTNAFNKKYITWSPGFRAFGYDTVYLGQPRMYGMRLRYNF